MPNDMKETRKQILEATENRTGETSMFNLKNQIRIELNKKSEKK